MTFIPSPGSLFPLGETIVAAEAFDFAGNKGTASFRVKVVDTTPPVLTVPPDVTIRSCARPNIGMATATDIASLPTVSNDAPDTFPLGMTFVMWRAVDGAGHVATGVQRV